MSLSCLNKRHTKCQNVNENMKINKLIAFYAYIRLEINEMDM